MILSTKTAVSAVMLCVAAVQGLLGRDKRYTYYSCGTWPNQYTSVIPCDEYSLNAVCSNTGYYMGRRCIVDTDCFSPFELSTCLDTMCCSVPTVPPQTTTASNIKPACAENSPSGGYCDKNACPNGYVCTTSKTCCRCYSGLDIGLCDTNGRCSAGYTCMPSGFCCSTAFNNYQLTTTTTATTTLRCIFGQCPTGYRCRNGAYCEL